MIKNKYASLCKVKFCCVAVVFAMRYSHCYTAIKQEDNTNIMHNNRIIIVIPCTYIAIA